MMGCRRRGILASQKQHLQPANVRATLYLYSCTVAKAEANSVQGD